MPSTRGAANRVTAEIMKPGENVEFEEFAGPLEAAEPNLYSNVRRENDRTDHFGIVSDPTLKAYWTGVGAI